MNCKQGDLAIIVKSLSGNEGKIVTCVKFLPNFTGLSFDGLVTCDAWEVDRELPTRDKKRKTRFFKDSNLRPIRDNPGADETLTWLPVPEKEAA